MASGFIRIKNKAGFRMRFSIRFRHENNPFNNYYTADGSNKSFPVGQDEAIFIPEGATDIQLNVQRDMFFGIWRSFYTNTFDNPVSRCYEVTGITVNPKIRSINCG